MTCVMNIHVFSHSEVNNDTMQVHVKNAPCDERKRTCRQERLCRAASEYVLLWRCWCSRSVVSARFHLWNQMKMKWNQKFTAAQLNPDYRITNLCESSFNHLVPHALHESHIWQT